MNNSVFALFAPALLLASSVCAKEVTRFRPVEGVIYEVAPIAATSKRVQKLRLPQGFQVAKFAEIQNPRMMTVAPNGNIYVTSRDLGTVRLLQDRNGDGVADVQKTVATRKQMHGVTIHNGKLYMVTVKEVYVAPIKADGTLGQVRQIIDDLPDGGQHPNRTLAVGPDGLLYISIGSTTNAAHETNREVATIVRCKLDGTRREIFASGLRNTIGFGWHPTTKRMWGWDQGIDWLGDDEQREEFNELFAKTKYGWPYVYERGKAYPHLKPLPQLGLTNTDWARQSRNPTLLHTAHSAGIQMAFYKGAMFPAQYRNDAFIALRGSWNRNPPSGYEVARVKFNARGQATRVEPFLSGFLVPGGDPKGTGKAAHFARLAGMAVAKDGALLVSDDTNNVIYRVSYGAPKMPAIMRREKVSALLPETRSSGNILVTSGAFKAGATIPHRNSAYFADASPSLQWSRVPNAKSYVVMMEDPDAMQKPTVHWLMANVPATTTSLGANLIKRDQLPDGAMQGGNVTGGIGYFGPRPPAGDPAHRYHFQVFALDTTLQLPSGFNRQRLLDAMRGHVIAKGTLIGKYKRVPDVRNKP